MTLPVAAVLIQGEQFVEPLDGLLGDAPDRRRVMSATGLSDESGTQHPVSLDS
jgi:hypothetical protein